MRYSTRLSCAVLVALAILSTASAGVNTPQSGWYSGNPLLGPNALRDLACAGSTCYAAGDFGTLLKSKDAGATWDGIVTGLTFDLTRVRLAGGSPDHVVVGGGCSVRRSDDGGDTFFRMPFTTRDVGCEAGVVSFSFPSEEIGYLLLSGGRVLATADGGHSFSRRTSVPGGVASDLLCTTDRTCLAAAPLAIMRTEDGAVSWTQVASAGWTLTSLEQADPLTLYAVGQESTMRKSVDGGRTWSSRTVGGVPVRLLSGIRCGDALHCLITTHDFGGAPGPLYRTTDGAGTFTSVVPSSDPTLSVAFASPVRAVVAGGAGSAEVSNDAGGTWSAVGSRIAGNFTTLGPVSETVAYAGGGGGVLARTTDAGQSWSNVSPPTEQGIDDLTGWGADRVYVLSSDGTLERSDNGGASYRLLNYGATLPPADIAATGPNRLLLIGVPRGVLRSDNGGETFQRVLDRDVRKAQLCASDFAGGAVVAYCSRVAAISTDGGTSWRRIALPRKRLIRYLDFVTPRVGYALDSRRALWRTRSGGRTWTQLFSLGTRVVSGLQFEDVRNGYVIVEVFGSLRVFGLVLHTSDSGDSWHPQIVSHDELSLLAVAGSTAYTLSGGSSLYATRTHGDIGAARSLSLAAGRVQKGGAVVLRGRLLSAAGGEEVVVSRYAGGRWTSRRAIASSSGTFALRWSVRRRAIFVAQVLGDADHTGAGTPPLTVVRPTPASGR